MGMFDNVQCEYPLPDGLTSVDKNFQTKSMDSVLDTYIITEHGDLYRYEWPTTYNLIGEQERKPDFIDYTGSMNFYTSVDGQWHEYTATFIHGKLTEIETSSRFDR